MSILFYIKLMKINELTPDRTEYLKILQNIAKPPKRLWCVGELPTKRLPTVAIIGSRKPTTYGREVAHNIAAKLAKHGIVIVSGLALGIDGIAHKAALEAGGITLAVMAGGLDSVHPRSHREIALNIVTRGGALISEYPPGAQPFPSNFIERNRLVSGISDAVLVVEASAKSGTIHTANFALEQGREVLAIPGNITSAASEGCNNLIKSGAAPVTSATDVLHALGLTPANTQTELPLGDTPHEQTLLQLLHSGLRDGDELQKQSGLAPALFGQTLTMLEISGRVRALGANQWSLN